MANASEIAGKIAMIDRGDCFFEEKTLNAEDAGAIAVIICNYLDEAIGMAGGVDNVDPLIPTVSLSFSDCNTLKSLMANGETVTVSISVPENSGPEKVSSSFDNGVIAHEFGHGISNRLTGGRSADDCLFNDEQMGEGWSDFFTLITSTRPGDTGATPRGIGNYSDRQPVNGGGIRRVSYSTDMTINPHNMDDIIATGAPHPLGEVWVSAIWDLYWAMVDIYGYDEDLMNGTGGNNKAIQLVMDGMALQRCNPGFMDARDALFTADYLNYDGVHECLIWEVFARRGMGFDADQFDRFDRNDNTMGFEVLPVCIQELKIRKSANSDLINPGDVITFRLEVANDKPIAATGVMVQDELPNGLTYINGSAAGATAQLDGNTLRFDLGDMGVNETITITYQAQTSTSQRSIRQFYDGMENGDGNWEFLNLAGDDIWDINNFNPHTGARSWYVPNTATRNDQLLTLFEPFEVTGVRPAIRFYHSYDTEPANDGGLVQISRNGGSSWENIADKYIRNGYRGDLSPTTLFSIDFQAFWGNSNGYRDSYIDLSDYIGETIQVRFRFAANSDVSADGWYMDDFEIMDLFAYQGEACVSSNEGDLACAAVPNGGVVVESGIVNATEEIVYDPSLLHVYPNPASGMVYLHINAEVLGAVDVALLNVNGSRVREWRSQTLHGQQLALPTDNLPAGMYYLQVHTQTGIYSQKVVLE
ncbi:MAG: M36 family metallopeptidase [Saprospiraceae bacterium]